MEGMHFEEDEEGGGQSMQPTLLPLGGQEGSTLQDYGDEEVFFDSRVVKTVRNLKRINSATPKNQQNAAEQQAKSSSQLSHYNGGANGAVNTSQQQINLQPQHHLLGQHSAFVPRLSGISGSGLGSQLGGGGALTSTNNGQAEGGFAAEQNRALRGQQQQHVPKSQNPPMMRNSNGNLVSVNSTQNASLPLQAANLNVQQQPKKEETLEERIRRIRSKNQPLQQQQDENNRQQMPGGSSLMNLNNAGAFIQNQLALQKMNSAFGMQSNKTLNLQQSSLRPQNYTTGGQGFQPPPAPMMNGLMKQNSNMNPQIVTATSFISGADMSSHQRNMQVHQQSYAKLNGKGGPNSQSTTADSNNRISNDGSGSNQDNAYYYPEQQHQPQQDFGIRGVKPDSNINLETDLQLLEQKKDKCIEIFKTSSQVHDIIKDARGEALLSPMYRSNMEVNSMIQIMFSDRHFVNCLISQLGKKQAANKLEKFIAERLQEKVQSMIIDCQIQEKLESLNRRIQERVDRLKAQIIH